MLKRGQVLRVLDPGGLYLITGLAEQLPERAQVRTHPLHGVNQH
jgi:hypothetical protein